MADNFEFVEVPYRFEPPPLDLPQPLIVDVDEEGRLPGPPVREWCACQNCVVMPTRRESLCCHSHEKCPGIMEKAGVKCITLHPGFDAICINRYSIEVSFLEFLEDDGPMGDDEPIHEMYRYVSYRKFTRWTWRKLKKEDRRVIPSCAVTLIREAFPSEEYSGFRYARE